MKLASDKATGAELPSFRLDGRIVVVTGASEGMGRIFATACAQSGAEVIVASRRRQKLLEVVDSIRKNGGVAHAVTLDVGRLPSVRTLAERVAKLSKDKSRPLVLINNAGFAFTKPALDITEKDWDRVFDVHAKGTFFCTQAIGRLMIERGYGKVINLSSTWSASTDTGKSAYGAAKAAISYMTAAFANEWGPMGVRVNAIAPTATLSENTIQNLRRNPARTRQMLGRIRLGRFAQPSDMVGAILFLASPASDFVTGHTLFVDGGWHTSGW